ncbi:MAG: pilus assembly protein [Proteobacteria bacterium]|nr:pilus assembly protein [Pseudomonadota bacterium]
MRRLDHHLNLAQRGASLVEFTVVVPVLLLIVLGIIQTALAFHAKSNLNYAVFQAARAGSVQHAVPATMFGALARALVPYFGGGASTVELLQRLAAVNADLAQGSARLEILSPTARSFDDYYSPELAVKFGGGRRVIPNVDILNLRCPRDRPACASDPASNASGQSLQDANLLTLRVTYGIPPSKQVPLTGRLYTTSLKLLGIGREDAFVADLLEQDRIPIVARATIRMSSEPFESPAVQLSGAAGAGSGGGGGSAPGGGGAGQGGSPGTDPGSDGGSSLPPHCRPGDSHCDPDCGVRLCCVTPTFPK